MATNGLGKSSPLDKAAKRSNELFDEDGGELFNRANTSTANMISPYYGGDERMQTEVDKAKSYGASRGGKFSRQTKEAYDKLSEPVLTQFGKKMSYYKPSTQFAIENDDEFYPAIGIKGGEPLKAERDRLKAYKADSMNPEDKKKFEDFLKVNGFDLNVYEKSLGKDYGRSALEHESGHNFTNPFAYGNEGSMYAVKKVDKEGRSTDHMADPVELVNVVGRIQRERFKKGEGRFEGEEDLKNYVRKTPYDKAIEDYSPEAIRGWKTLYEEQDPSKPEVNWLLDYASKLAPALVKNQRQTGLGSYS